MVEPEADRRWDGRAGLAVVPIPVLRCPACGHVQEDRGHASRRWCRACGQVGPTESSVSPFGRVIASTRIHVAPAEFDPPFVVVAAALEGGLVLFARCESEVPTPVSTEPQWMQLSAGSQTEPPTAVLVRQEEVPGRIQAQVKDDERASRACATQGVRPGGLASPGARIAGVGMTKFGKWPALDDADLAAQATLAAVEDSDLALSDIDGVFAATAFGSMALAQRLATILPLAARPAFNIENACASSTTALLQAATWLEAGCGDVALVVGVDVVGRTGGVIPLTGTHSLLRSGAPLPAVYAMAGSMYLREFGYTRKDLAHVAVRSRHLARSNPYARMREPVTLESVLEARPVAEPLHLFDCCPNADGAAAALLVSPRLAGRRAVRIRSALTVSGTPRDKIASPGIAAPAASRAYELASIGPQDIDVAEVHAPFTPAEPLAIEAMGLAPRGEALHQLIEGVFSVGGEGCVVNSTGGMLSRGHPPGATGLAQVHDIVRQLRGEAGDNQAQGPVTGLVHNQGGSVLELDTNACSVLVLSTS